MTFRDRLAEQRWDDHRYYHHNRVNQALHLANTLRFSSWPPTSRGRRRHDYVGIAAAKRDDAAMHETPQGEHQALHCLEYQEQRRDDVDRIVLRQEVVADPHEHIRPLPDARVHDALDRECQHRADEGPRMHAGSSLTARDDLGVTVG